MEALRGIVDEIWRYETDFKGQVSPCPPISPRHSFASTEPARSGIPLVSCSYGGAPPGRHGSTGSGTTQRYHAPRVPVTPQPLPRPGAPHHLGQALSNPFLKAQCT